MLPMLTIYEGRLTCIWGSDDLHYVVMLADSVALIKPMPHDPGNIGTTLPKLS